MAHKNQETVMPTIGLLGGMGSYATLDYFKRILDAFPADKEWERPHIIIDNYCTMPSRVKAIMTGEDLDIVVDCMTSSIKQLYDCGARAIIITCNTAHYFLPYIIKKIPYVEPYIINMIDICVNHVKNDVGTKYEVKILGSEATLKTNLYKNAFEKSGIRATQPEICEYPMMRSFMEAVKQNNVTEKIMADFSDYINGSDEDVIILGCTEFPIIYQYCINNNITINKKIYDPIDCTIYYLVNHKW